MAWKNVQYENGKYRTSEGGGGGSSTFAGLDDVSFSNLQNGQVPKYNSTTQKWENANESGGGGTVTDVTVDGTSVVNQQGVAEIETPEADAIDYDNQQSRLQATNIQDAIDELAQGSGGGGVEDVEVNGTSVVNAQNVAEIKSYKEVTQAEYQALPSSKLTDNILYCIKDSAGADGFPPLIYSEEEREIGVWTDGKPLYQKVIVWNDTTAKAYVRKDIHDLNIDTLVSITGFFNRLESNNKVYWYPFNSMEASSEYGFYRIDNENGYTNGQILWRINYNNTNTQRFIFTYTKTTDTAGSGTWTTQGGYAHHYSTTEQVIGTWIDGKPLYEKTYTQTYTNGGSKQIDISDIPFDYIWMSEGSSAIAYNNSVQTLNYGTGGNYTVFALVNRNGKYIETACSGNEWMPWTVYITLRYTKTTD